MTNDQNYLGRDVKEIVEHHLCRFRATPAFSARSSACYIARVILRTKRNYFNMFSNRLFTIYNFPFTSRESYARRDNYSIHDILELTYDFMK